AKLVTGVRTCALPISPARPAFALEATPTTPLNVPVNGWCGGQLAASAGAPARAATRAAASCRREAIPSLRYTFERCTSTVFTVKIGRASCREKVYTRV